MLFLTIFCLVLITRASAVCPEDTVFDSTFNRCYKFVTHVKPFFLAEQDCVSIGGHLASVQNAFENSLIAQIAKNTSGVTDQHYWIGYNELLTTMTWSWTDGSSFKYTNWANSQPSANDECGLVVAGGVWISENCGEHHPYACVVSPNYTPDAHAGYCERGWTYFNFTDSCYKVYTDDNFDNAEGMCSSMMGHLSSIHSEAENTFVSDMAYTGSTVDQSQMTWTGMKKVNNGWANTDGSKPDFYKWAPGQPNGANGDCVEILSDDLAGAGNSGERTYWSTVSCNKTMRAFVCKKPAKHHS